MFQKSPEKVVFTTPLHHLFFHKHSANIWEVMRLVGIIFKMDCFPILLDVGSQLLSVALLYYILPM